MKKRTLVLTEDEVQRIVNAINNRVSRVLDIAERETFEPTKDGLLKEANLLNELADDIEQGKKDA